MQETGRIIAFASLALLFIGLIVVRLIVYKPGKNKHISGTFPIISKHPIAWKMVFIVSSMIFILVLAMWFLIDEGNLEGLVLLVIIIPVLFGTSWSYSWQLKIFEDKMIFRNIFWRKKVINYEAITVVNRGTGIRAYKQKKFIFEATIWHENYEEVYNFISTKVKIKPFIRKKYMK